MKITPAIFQAYLDCPTKSYLRAHSEVGAGNEYADWLRAEQESYTGQETVRLANTVAAQECVRGGKMRHFVENGEA